MSENIDNQNDRQPTTPTPEDSGGQGENRTFTQEEVNRIVADRLARERAKAEPSPADEREQALKARESKLDCREYLSGEKLPAELADILDTSDAEAFKANVKRLAGLFHSGRPSGSVMRISTGGPLGDSGATGKGDAIADAFKPKI